MKPIVTAKVEYGNMVNVHTPKGELRLIFNEDGSFRLITDLPVTNVHTVLNKYPDVRGEFASIVEVERYGHPFED